MREWPYVIRPQDIKVRPDADGLYVAFRSEPPYRDELAWQFKQAFGCAFDTEVKIGAIGFEGEQRYASLKGLGLPQEERVRTLMNALHVVHTDGDECPDLCLALDWQKEPDDRYTRTATGEVEYQAKWRDDPVATARIAGMLYRIVRSHGALSTVNQIVAPPSTRALAGRLAERLGERLDIPALETRKEGTAPGQKISGERDFDALCERQVGTIKVQATDLAGSVLIVDDLYYSGGTIRELTRQCRALSAERILALTVTKSLKYHHRA